MGNALTDMHHASLMLCWSLGEGRVYTTGPLNPWKVLGLQSSNASFKEIKAAFKNKTTQTVRQNRAMASIAYYILTSSTDRCMREPGTDGFIIRKLDHFILAACGSTLTLTFLLIFTTRNLVEDKDERQRTLLYIASRSGFYDTCELLLRRGAPINAVQSTGSTPLHGAAYFGHSGIVALLLQHGARSDIKNNSGDTALEDSSTTEIRRLIQNASADRILSLTAQLRQRNLIWIVRLIKHEGEVIAKELIRNRSALDESTRAKWNEISRNWEKAWHGTRYRHLESIIRNGLQPAGTHGIKPLEGHFKLDQEFRGVSNWAKAIFLSPSILYASNEVYSDRVISESKQWCVLIKAYCKPGSYVAYKHTVLQYKPMVGEPEMPEYRVPVNILRVESARNVVVNSLMFVRLSFLENPNINFEKAMELLS